MILGANAVIRKQGLSALEQVEGIGCPFPRQSAQKNSPLSSTNLIENGEELSQVDILQEFLGLKAQLEEQKALVYSAETEGTLKIERAQPDRVVGPGIVIKGRLGRKVLNLGSGSRRTVLSLDEQGRFVADLGSMKMELLENGNGTYITLHQPRESMFYHLGASGDVSFDRKSKHEIA